jgi:hypothetical protein
VLDITLAQQGDQYQSGAYAPEQGLVLLGQVDQYLPQVELMGF